MAMIIIGALACLFLVWRFVRPGRKEENENNEHFTLQQIRELHKSGRISEIEFETLKKQIIQENTTR